ncbi:MAG: transport system ATPase, partial [Bacteriovoracaceae bacterium]|nr:transport system ATPase [Bacteriovoracaceae bacterium]
MTILVLQPETGDEIQWMKSGVRELADLFVVHKSDLGGAELMMQSLIENGAHKNRVVQVSSSMGRGLEDLLNAIKLVQTEMEWNRRLRSLHLAHARDL